MTTLVKFNEAYQALMVAKTVDEIKEILDWATALKAIYKQTKDGREMQNACAEMIIRGKIRGAEIVEEMQANGQLNENGGDRKSVGHDVKLKLPDLGVSYKEIERWRKLKAVPEEAREEFIVTTTANLDEITEIGMIRFASQLKTPEPATTPPLPPGKYRCIVIDPPWPVKKIERDERPNQGIELDYPTMTLDEIEALPVSDIADESGCHLYLWITQKFLPVSLKLVASWGFNYQCLMTWKKNVGMTPYSWMYDTEHVIFARRGNLPLQQLGLRLSFEAPVNGHSVKPDVFYEHRVKLASPEPRLEMFARKQRDGFEVWGNEV